MFAIFLDIPIDSASPNANHFIEVKEKACLHRIRRVLRLKEGERLILFNRQYYADVRLETLSEKFVTFKIVHGERIVPPMPALTVLLPYLKRDALDDAVYAVVQAGARSIALVPVQRAHPFPAIDTVMDRLAHVAIAAAEQSKQFFLPKIVHSASLEAALSQVEAQGRFFADPAGKLLLDVLDEAPHESCAIAVGPEAGFSREEIELLNQYNFTACSLTSAILRSEQALALLAYVCAMHLKSNNK